MSSSSSKDSDFLFRTVTFLRSNFGKVQKSGENDKIPESKIKPTHSKEDEKRRQKEEEVKLRKQQDKEKEQERNLKRRNSKLPINTIESLLRATDKNNIPIFLHKCVQFIEQEGLESEGIYRIPGNRAHVDLLFEKFEDDSNVDIKKLDIAVNAVATALKDFFSKRYPPLFGKEFIAELEEIAGLRNTPSDTCMNMCGKMAPSCRLLAYRDLLKKLPDVNFAILKFIFQHFVQVSANSTLNSMDSRNLAICWWPTLIRIEFTNISRFEQLRPYLEDFVETMIDQFSLFFL